MTFWSSSTKTKNLAALLALAALAALSGCGNSGATATELVREERAAATGSDKAWFETELVPSDPSPTDFGYAVALSGRTALVGAFLANAVYVFTHGESWEQTAKLSPPHPMDYEDFGWSVAISGDRAVVGAPYRDDGETSDVGAIYVFERTGTTWGEPTMLTAYDPVQYAKLGYSVAIDGNTILAGAPGATGPAEASGAAYVFTKSGGDWHSRKLVPTDDVSLGYGEAVALAPEHAFIGAPESNGSDGYNGMVGYVAVLDRADWTEEDKLRVAKGWPGDQFGGAIAASGDLVVIGAAWGRGAHEGYTQGQAYVFELTSFGWNPRQSLFAPDAMDGFFFGSAVGISGDTVMVGTLHNDTVYVFSPLDGPMPTERLGEKGRVPYFGRAIAMDGDVAIVGAGFQDERGAYAEEYLLTDGNVCESDAECGNHHCVSGFCCNRACEGDCATCEDGTCAARRAGEPGSPSCRAYVCDGASLDCPDSCDSNGDCASTHYCKSHECVERLEIGSSCDVSRQCATDHCVDGVCQGTAKDGTGCEHATECNSGFCVDGVCCDSACGDQCEACDVAGARGTCSPVIDEAPHGSRDACAGDNDSCRGTCQRGNTRGCTFPPVTTPCGSTCTDGVQTPETCDGRGACVAREPTACENLVCENDEVCKTSCEDREDCLPGYNCLDGECVSRPICVEGSSISPDGASESCGAFTCDDETGSCRTSCVDADECAAGNACYPNGICAPPEQASTSADPEGCSCSSIGKRRPSETGALLGLVLALGFFGRRRWR